MAAGHKHAAQQSDGPTAAHLDDRECFVHLVCHLEGWMNPNGGYARGSSALQQNAKPLYLPASDVIR